MPIIPKPEWSLWEHPNLLQMGRDAILRDKLTAYYTDDDATMRLVPKGFPVPDNWTRADPQQAINQLMEGYN